MEKNKRDYNKPNIINLGRLSERTKAAGGKNDAGSDSTSSSRCKIQGGTQATSCK